VTLYQNGGANNENDSVTLGRGRAGSVSSVEATSARSRRGLDEGCGVNAGTRGQHGAREGIGRACAPGSIGD
jgi:hypothetical protein